MHEYNIKDHLGNTRVTYSDANNDGVLVVSDMVQLNHFYAFGLNMEGNWNGAAGSNKYQYNGKEWNDNFGLGWNDYGARWYDPAVARWIAIDPLMEVQENWSGYHYVYNNPMLYNDPSGMIGNALTTNVVNKETGENYNVNDGYNFNFYVNNFEFNEIKDKGKIAGTSVYGRWVKEATSHLLGKFVDIFENKSKKLVKETAEAIDEGLFDGAGESAINGDYSKAALMVLLSRFNVSGLKKFSDLIKISNKLNNTKKGLQYEISGASVKEIFGELGKNGFKIVEKIGDKSVRLRNSMSGEEIIIRKSKSGNYNTFDTVSGQVNGVQTDIRVNTRN